MWGPWGREGAWDFQGIAKGHRGVTWVEKRRTLTMKSDQWAAVRSLGSWLATVKSSDFGLSAMGSPWRALSRGVACSALCFSEASLAAVWTARRGTRAEAASPDGKLLQEPKQEKVEAGRRRRAGVKKWEMTEFKICFDGRADHTGSWFRHGVWEKREVKNDSHQTVSSSRTGNLSYLSPYLQCQC